MLITNQYLVNVIRVGRLARQRVVDDLKDVLDARSIVERSLGIAADICIYTNRNLVIDELKQGAA